MKITQHILLLVLLMICTSSFSQSICYFKVINIDNGELVINAIATSDSKTCTISKTSDGVFEVLNLKNGKKITFSAENYESKYHDRPKKKYESARDLNKMFVLHDNDTMIIQLLPNEKMLKKIWEEEDAAYGKIDTTGCIKHPERVPYPNDTLAFFTAINKEVRYPQQAIEENSQGKVLVGAVVETDGTITNVHIIRSIDRFLDRAALRAVRKAKLPILNPAAHNGQIVRCIIAIPVAFTLN
jgi:TonB family protein